MTPQADTSDKHDKAPSRPAMPSGTVRARRIHPRYRKPKGRPEQNLEPAAPGPDIVANQENSNNNSTNSVSRSRPTDPKRNKNPIHQPHHQFKNPVQSIGHPQSVQPVHPIVKSATAASTPIIKVSPVQKSSNHTNQTPVKSTTSHHHVDTPRPTPQHTSAAHGSDTRKVSPPAPTTQPLQSIENCMDHHVSSNASMSPRLIVDISPVKSQYSSVANHDDEVENSLPDSSAEGDESSTEEAKPCKGVSADADLEQLNAAAQKIKVPKDTSRARPLICQDITNSNADTLRISRLPHGVTYDRLLCMVEPFGEVDELAWTASDPYVCDVTYRDAAAAREAKHFLGDALVGNDSEPPLKAELRSRDPGAQLFVGDLTPDVTEEMLEATFSELVGEPVSALLKRDPDSFSPIGYGFLSFKSESSANFALVAGHRIKVGNACVRIGRAERNTYLYVSDLAPDVSAGELKNVFGKFGSLVDEDTVIIRRSYAFIRYKNRGAAEKAKRTLDKTELKGRLSVRYAEAEPLKACVAVQFHSSVPRPPNSLRDLLSATFSKHGNCSVEIPRLQNGMWRKVAFVTFHGEPIAANLAALEAVQSIRFVSSLPVCCQFARELIPRLPSRGMIQEKMGGVEADRANSHLVAERSGPRNFFSRKNAARRAEQGSENANGRGNQQQYDQRMGQYGNETASAPGGTDFVPVYVPISALQHPGGMNANAPQTSEAEFAGFQQPWQTRMIMTQGPNATAAMLPQAPHYNANYNSFAPLQDRVLRW